MDTVWPKLYSERPVQPTPVRMEAAGRVRTGMVGVDWRARRRRSVCVVALGVIRMCETGEEGEGDVREGISDYEEGDVDFVCVCEDRVAGGFDHFAVGDDYGAAIEGLLLRWISSVAGHIAKV